MNPDPREVFFEGFVKERFRQRERFRRERERRKKEPPVLVQGEPWPPENFDNQGKKCEHRAALWACSQPAELAQEFGYEIDEARKMHQRTCKTGHGALLLAKIPGRFLKWLRLEEGAANVVSRTFKLSVKNSASLVDDLAEWGAEETLRLEMDISRRLLARYPSLVPAPPLPPQPVIPPPPLPPPPAIPEPSRDYTVEEPDQLEAVRWGEDSTPAPIALSTIRGSLQGVANFAAESTPAPNLRSLPDWTSQLASPFQPATGSLPTQVHTKQGLSPLQGANRRMEKAYRKEEERSATSGAGIGVALGAVVLGGAVGLKLTLTVAL